MLKMRPEDEPYSVKRILVGGRNAQTRSFLRDLLSSWGYTVVEAVNSEHAQAIIDQLQNAIDLMIWCSDANQEQRNLEHWPTDRPQIPLLTVSCDNARDREGLAGQLPLQVRLALESTLGGSVSVMVVDEDESERNLLATLLETAGYRVTQAANGRTALALLARNSTRLVLTDIVMTELDGLELIHQVRKHHLTTRLIAMSGGPRADGYLSVARLMGAEATLKKPLNVDQLLQTLRNLSTKTDA